MTVVCRVHKCRRPARVDGMCASHATRRADELFSRIVRAHGACQSGRTEHAGALQCAHGFSRSYKATRWSRRNAWALCAGCHTYFTHHPIEWDAFMRERLGHGLYEELRALALTHVAPDMGTVLADLEALSERMT